MTIDQRCSFCAKRRDQVERLVAGGAMRGVFICDECARLAAEVVEEDLRPRTPPARSR